MLYITTTCLLLKASLYFQITSQYFLATIPLFFETTIVNTVRGVSRQSFHNIHVLYILTGVAECVFIVFLILGETKEFSLLLADPQGLFTGLGVVMGLVYVCWNFLFNARAIIPDKSLTSHSRGCCLIGVPPGDLGVNIILMS